MENRLEFLNDLGCQRGGWRQILKIFERFVLEPEDVEVGFVPRH